MREGRREGARGHEIRHIESFVPRLDLIVVKSEATLNRKKPPRNAAGSGNKGKVQTAARGLNAVHAQARHVENDPSIWRPRAVGQRRLSQDCGHHVDNNTMKEHKASRLYAFRVKPVPSVATLRTSASRISASRTMQGPRQSTQSVATCRKTAPPPRGLTADLTSRPLFDASPETPRPICARP